MNELKLKKQFPVLRSDRLSFVELTESHMNDVYDIFSNDSVTRFYDCYSYTEKAQALKLIEIFKERFQSGNGIRWGITLSGNSKIIGTIGFNRFHKNGVGVLGYDLNETYWNKGITSEAIKTIIVFGFKELEIHRIEAEVIPENFASQVVLEKNGFKKEGVLREKGYWKDKHHSLILFSKLVTDQY